MSVLRLACYSQVTVRIGKGFVVITNLYPYTSFLLLSENNYMFFHI